jgi:hypothetical protein
MELNPIICRNSFKLVKISKKFEKLQKLDTLLYSLKHVLQKNLKSFVQRNSCPLYRVSNTTECFGSKHSAQLPFLPSVIYVPNVRKRNTQHIYIFY